MSSQLWEVSSQTNVALDADLSLKEDVSNKSTDVALGNSNTLYPTQNAVKTYADSLAIWLLDYRWAYDASGNTFPTSGWSWTAWAILKWDMFIISVAWTLGWNAVQIWDSIIASIDTPWQTAWNWNVLNSNISFIPENSANKVTSISWSSTDAEYPSAKLLYDQLLLKTSAWSFVSSWITWTSNSLAWFNASWLASIYWLNWSWLSNKWISWTTRVPASDSSWYAVAYWNWIFVSVSAVGSIMTSEDWVNWTTRTAPEANAWYSVVYGNWLFVAIANSWTNRVMTSPDWITWTARSAPEANSRKIVTYWNWTFVAVASSWTNRVMTSTDWITWTSRSAAEANLWQAVTYWNGLFVAVSINWTNRIMTSPDWITWTARAATEANSWYAVTYWNWLFIAVSISGTNRVMTSPNWITWTARSASAANSWRNIAYWDWIFVAVANTWTLDRVMTSPDWITWTARTNSVDNQWYWICYWNWIFVATAIDWTSSGVMTSWSIESMKQNERTSSSQSSSSDWYSVQTFIAWENITVWDNLAYSYTTWDWTISETTNHWGVSFWTTYARNYAEPLSLSSTWYVQKITSVKVYLFKQWSPTDNITLWIYQDDLITLVENSTNTISWSSLTTSATEQTFNFSTNLLIPNKNYYLILKRSWSNNDTNYYQYSYTGPSYSFDSTGNWNYSGVWGYKHITAITTYSIDTTTVKKMKANDPFLIQNIWIATETITSWNNIKVQLEWIVSWLTWLTPNLFYFASNTAWWLSTTPSSTYNIQIWKAITSSKILINIKKSSFYQRYFILADTKYSWSEVYFVRAYSNKYIRVYTWFRPTKINIQSANVGWATTYFIWNWFSDWINNYNIYSRVWASTVAGAHNTTSFRCTIDANGSWEVYWIVNFLNNWFEVYYSKSLDQQFDWNAYVNFIVE